MTAQMIPFAVAILALFGWLAVTWRRAVASTNDLEHARKVVGALVAELRRSQAEVLELQIRVDRLEGGTEPGAMAPPVRE